MAAIDDETEWENKWVQLEQSAWGQRKKKGQMPEVKLRDQWRKISEDDRRVLGPMLIEYFTLVEESQGAEFETRDVEKADLNVLNHFLVRVNDLESKVAPSEALNRRLRRERENRGGADDYDVLGLLDLHLNQIRENQPKIVERRENIERHLRLRREEREERNKRRREEEARQRSADDVRHGFGSLNSRWVGGPDLGKGGYATARLWLKVDERGRIADRMAVKDSEYYEHAKAATWDPAGLIPNEVTAMYKLRPLRGSECIAQIRNWRISKPQRMYRIYMDYCEHGALHQLIWDQKRHSRGQQTKYMPSAPFAWKLLEDLVTAGILMERGDLQGQGPSGWSLLVHRDIKPGNIFLTHNTSDTFKGFPTAVVGDFGMCAILPPGDRRTARDFRVPAYVFSVPEQVNQDLEDASKFPNPQRLTSQSNVWQIGMIMWCYLKGEPFGQANLKDFDWKTPRRPDDFTAEQRAIYSEELCDTVMACLKYLPEERATFDELRNWIRQSTTSGEGDLVHGLRWAPADSRGFTRYAALLKKEGYPLRSMLVDELRPADVDGMHVRLPPRQGDDAGDESASSSDDSLGGSAGKEMDFPDRPRHGVPPPPPGPPPGIPAARGGTSPP